MKYWYKSSKDRIGGIPAIKHRLTKEIEINSEYGIIYPNEDNTYTAIVTSSYRARMLGWKGPTSKDSEYVIPVTDLDQFIKILDIKMNTPAMVRRANNFGKK